MFIGGCQLVRWRFWIVCPGEVLDRTVADWLSATRATGQASRFGALVAGGALPPAIEEATQVVRDQVHSSGGEHCHEEP